MEQLLAALQSARIYDLAQPYYPGMPHHPNHPPFLFGLNKKHGDYVARNGASSASEGLTLGGHVGTHIDALCHFSCGGKLHGGRRGGGLANLRERAWSGTRSIPSRRFCAAASCWISPGTWAWKRCPPISKSRLNIWTQPRPRREVEVAARRCSAAAHRMGALLGRCRALHRASARAGAGRGRRALAQQPGCIRRRLRYRGLREGARLRTCRCTSICWWKAASTLSSA